MTRIAARFRKEQRPTCEGEIAPPLQVGFQQAARDLPIANHTLRAVLGVLGTNTDLAIGEVNIADLHGHQFFTAQGALIGQEQHDLVAQRLCAEGGEHLAPLLIAGNPRELLVARYQTAVTRPTKPFAGDVMASADRVNWTQLLLNQVVAEE